MERFAGKVVVVTGGGSGIGAATATRFAREGARLVLAGRDTAKLEAQAAAIGTADTVRWRSTDVGVPAENAALIDFALTAFGRIDVLVNNAGSGGLGRVTQIEPASWHAQIATNLDSVFYGCRAAIPHLAETKGSVVNIASIAGTAADYGQNA